MGPTSSRSSFEPKSILVFNWLLFLGDYNQQNVPPSSKAPSYHLCTWAAGRCIKMGISRFALIQGCDSAAGTSHTSQDQQELWLFTIIMLLNCQLWGFGKDKGKRPWHCPSPHPLQEQGATSPCPAPLASKGSCTWRTWGAKGVWWLRWHQHKTDSLSPPPSPPYFPHQPNLLPFILYQDVINPPKESMYFNTKQPLSEAM